MTAFRLGLTGSIGMGKSTTAAIFADQGIPVWDADATVHRLYAAGGAAAVAVAAHYPTAMTSDGAVSREALKSLIRADASVLDHLSSIVHPIVAADRAAFITQAASDIVLLDIPLLYETGADQTCDAVLVVTAPQSLQRARIMARGQMSEADLAAILGRQMPDAEKRSRATHIVETLSIPAVQAYVVALLAHIRQYNLHA
jgi:dephospho-CoA kinase